jgi:hypothetical protein
MHAFILRSTEEVLSVNWLDCLGLSDRAAELAEIWRVLGLKLKIRGNAKLAVLNVGNARSTVQAGTPDRRNIDILHDPDEKPGAWTDPSHSSILHLQQEDLVVAEQLALCIDETYDAR